MSGSSVLKSVVTVGDSVRLTKDLHGTVQFVGEIQGRKGIYYGIELNEARGKSNGTVGNVRYFKCKAKRGLFLRYARIQEVIANDSIPRIGISDYVHVVVDSSKKCIGQVRYIGIPARCSDVYYGVQLRKPVGDCDGTFRGTRYFGCSKKCASFFKSSSQKINKVAKNPTRQNEQNPNPKPNTNGSTEHGATSNKGTSDKNNNSNIDNFAIQLAMYSESNVSGAPLFHIHLPNNFSFKQLSDKIKTMTQYVSTIFELKFRSKLNGYADQDVLLDANEFKTLGSHFKKSGSFYEHGKFIVFEPLKRGVFFEQQGMLTEALDIYQRTVDQTPASTEALTYYANCLVLVNKFEKAEAYYKRAIELNPFAGDICYFYSRLLEYKNKFDDGKALCSQIMNYAKNTKSKVPPPHHQIHYSCYARLAQKYIALSMDRHARDKLNAEKSLQQYNKEKKELQVQIESLQRQRQRQGQRAIPNEAAKNSKSQTQSTQSTQNMSLLNQHIKEIELQLTTKEQILQKKNEELITKQNKIASLKHELSSARNESKESAAKLLAQKQNKNMSHTSRNDSSALKKNKNNTNTNNTNTNTNGAKANNNKKVLLQNKFIGVEPSSTYTDYASVFDQLHKAKKQQHQRTQRLKNKLLVAHKMASLVGISDPVKRQQLMKDKLELCSVVCDFEIVKETNKDGKNEDQEGDSDGEGEGTPGNVHTNNTTTNNNNLDEMKSEEIASETKRIENKKDLLLEVLQCMSGNKWNSIDLLRQCLETIWNNLFRALPDENMIRTDPNDDEMDFRDPAWDHLQLIYELTFHVVTNTHIDKKTMKKHLQGAFLENLIHLFSACDDREPQYVKIIAHAIYGRFMALRKAIRKHLSDYCFRYIYTSKYRDTSSWQGLPEILEIFCSIFQGLNVPVKPDYHIVLRNVIVPLHKSFHLDEFHEQLLQCCTQFVTKDPHSAPVILGGILKFWPNVSPLKEQLFITEIVHILNVCVRHPQIKQSDAVFASVTIAVLRQFVRCMISPHHQVAERSLMVWRDETVRICVDLHREKIWPQIYSALQRNKEKYWLSAIRNINRQIMSDFKRRDPEFFEKIEKQQQSNDQKIGNEHDFNSQQISKKQKREQRWKMLNKRSTK